jgi:hypothetical protein
MELTWEKQVAINNECHQRDSHMNILELQRQKSNQEESKSMSKSWSVFFSQKKNDPLFSYSISSSFLVYFEPSKQLWVHQEDFK